MRVDRLREQTVLRAVPQQRAVREVRQARLRAPLGVEPPQHDRILIDQRRERQVVLPAHGVAGREIPFAVAQLRRQAVGGVRRLRRQGPQRLAAAGHVRRVARQQQVAAVRADAKAHALHVSVCQIIFLQIAPEQRLGARAQSL